MTNLENKNPKHVRLYFVYFNKTDIRKKNATIYLWVTSLLGNIHYITMFSPV